jgi:hypothetical protein
MSEPRIVTEEIVRLVDEYVRKQLDDKNRYANSTPLDESGVYSLHLLASVIYAQGFDAGERVEAMRNHGAHMRQRELEKKQSVTGEAEK